MPYTIPGFAAIRQRMLRDAANLDPTAPQDRDSDLYVRSSATASAVSGLYDFLAWQARQLLPDTADPEYLEQHCALRGITRKPATRATGTLTLTGRTGAVVPAGTQARDLSGVLYRSVADAQVYPLRQGAGTVDVVITGPDGIPGEDVVAACQAHIDAERPVTALATVYAPLALSVDMTLKLRVAASATLESLRPDVRAALETEITDLRPGEPLVLSRCAAAVSGLAGVADVVITAPAANVQPTDLQWCRLGTLTLEAL